MDSSPPLPSTLLLLLLLLTLTSPTTPTPTPPTQELETTLHTLRTHGRTLFTNAISTSDLLLHLLSTSSFTLFAPTNAPLFALDLSSDASAYVTTLRYHVIPNRRLSFQDLRNLSSPFLDTLLPHYSVLIGHTLDSDAIVFNGSVLHGVMVDGVRVSEPDLFLGPRIAVHGIDGILVTGLNINHQDFDDQGNGSGLVSPAGAPTGGFSWNIPVARVPAQTPRFDSNDVVPETPPPPAWARAQPVGGPPVSSPPPGRAEAGKRKGKRRRKAGVHRRHKRRVHHHRPDDDL